MFKKFEKFEKFKKFAMFKKYEKFEMFEKFKKFFFSFRLSWRWASPLGRYSSQRQLSSCP